MNRAKLLTLILLLSVTVIGAGYAYWSEALIINSTVTTAELRVEFEDIENIVEPDYPDIEDMEFPDYRVPTKLIDENHTLIAAFRNVFPGLRYSVPFKLINKGTIPATFKNCTVTSDIKDSCLKSGESEDALITQLNANLKIKYLHFRIFDGNGAQIGSTTSIVNGTPINLVDLAGKINTALNNLTLYPGQYLQVSSDQNIEVKKLGGKVTFLFSSDFGNDFENRDFSVKINMNWKQFNEPN